MATDLAHVSLVSLRSMVVEIYQAWAQTDAGKAASGAGSISAHLSSGEYDALLEKIVELKTLVQQQHGEGTPVARPQRAQQRQQQQQRARRPAKVRMITSTAGDCPLGGRQHPPTSAAAFCVPIDEEDADGLHALAMCALFQQAADDGAEAFARATTTDGPPAVLCAGAVGGIDVPAYGFAVEQLPPPDQSIYLPKDFAARSCKSFRPGFGQPGPSRKLPAAGEFFQF
ncbi:hypothetical protein CYMTET_8770 [Cymbomonas tetramitiformis]|uniref:Uncharacterized protein n=1 Tax=Cymbomonas tetramitiformis TaxID=36881 RepID=A0AAE0GT32_9CHLO|nr:hypothetical protein CYMTET_8770 [Cymbomonas tetramitiformis]